MIEGRWTPSVRDAVSDWFADPLERVLLVALVLVSGWLLVVLSTQEAGAPADDVCVVSAVEDARAFARVLGDDRSIPASFAEAACARS